MTTRAEVRVGSVEAAAYTVPTDRPEADGTLAWTSTTLVVVRVRPEDPSLPAGLGWTYAPAAAAAVVRDLLADQVVGRSALDVRGAWESMVRSVRNAGRRGIAGMAISALDVALWDLEARLLDVPLHRLLGGGRDEVPVYGSGGFTTYDDQTLRAQLGGWVEQGIPRVKIKIAESWGTRTVRDLSRVVLAADTVGDGVELYVDANGGYTVKEAIRIGERLAAVGVTWFEEPVSSDDVEGLRRVRDGVDLDVTAGEYGWDLATFRPLVGALDCVQIDATRCGGYTEWLRVAALAAAYGLDVSGHCAPALHAPVAMATPNLRHVEWFHDHVRIEAMAFAPAYAPGGGVIRPPEEPGHGLALREADLEPYRVA